MKNARQKKILIITVLAVISTCTDSVFAASYLQSPEIESGQLQGQIHHLNQKLKSLRSLYKINAKRHVSDHIQNIIKSSSDLYSKKNYLAAIDSYKNILKKQHLIPTDDYLIIQKNLSDSLLKVGELDQSFKACQRFLVGFSGHPNKNYDDLLDVIQRMIELSRIDQNLNKREIREELTAILSLQIPKTYYYELTYLSSVIANQLNMKPLSIKWLKAAAKSEDKKTKARSLYFQALIAISLKRWQEAKKLLESALSSSKAQNSTLEEYCRLALARLHHRRGHYQLAVKTYQEISEDSPLYEEGSFEQIFSQLSQKKYEDALILASSYIASFPSGKFSQQVLNIMPYLNIQAQHYGEAKEAIKTKDQKLKAIEKAIHTKYARLENVSEETLQSLINTTKSEIEPSKTLRVGLKIYDWHQQQQQTLNTLKGQLQYTIHSLGHHPLKSLDPQLYLRHQRLLNLGRKALRIGNRYVEVQKKLFKNSISSIDHSKLDLLAKRRKNLSLQQDLRYHKASSKIGDSKHMGIRNHLAQQWFQLDKIRSRLTPLRLQKKLASSDSKATLFQYSAIEGLNHDINQIQKQLSHVYTRLQIIKLEDTIDHLERHPDKNFLNKYALILQDELQILETYRAHGVSVVSRMLHKDMNQIQRQWTYLMSGIYQDLSEINTKKKSYLTKKLNSIKSIKTKIDQASFTLDQEKGLLDEKMRQAMPSILEHYIFSLDNQLARNQKWFADLKWIEYQEKDQIQKTLNEDYLIEQQILKDHAYHLKQGVLWKWPE